MTLTLPFPPTLNHMYGFKGWQRYIKPAGRQFRAEVCRMVNEQGCEPMTGRLAVVVELFPDSRRRMDVMNREKALSDALTHAGLWTDDSQIDDFRIVRREIVKGGAVRVLVEEMEDAITK
jgi:crossover junction endodeoxyribonuclease RusA